MLAVIESKSFLWQKYVVESLSIAEIADIINAAPSSVHKYLTAYAIPVREPGDNIQRKAGRGLAFGRKIAHRQEVDHKRELEVIARVQTLRAEKFSYWKIADILNALKIPTKTRRGKWHARSVQQILDRAHHISTHEGMPPLILEEA